MRAAVIDQTTPNHVTVRDVGPPILTSNEALVKQAATAITPLEIYYSRSGGRYGSLGCDVAGVVEKAAADGSGPKQGARVVGRVDTGAWAELVAVPTYSLAELPTNVTFEQAATLPTSALTALYVLEKGRGVLGRNVLITAANGSVGLFACQLARLMGAVVVGQIKKHDYIDMTRQSGADDVIVSEDGSEISASGPYKLIADAVGGTVLSNCIGALDRDGVCVAFGNVSEENAMLDFETFLSQPRACLRAFVINDEFTLKPASEGLSRLVRLVSEGKLRTNISIAEPVDRIDNVVQDLLEHRQEGKAVIKFWM